MLFLRMLHWDDFPLSRRLRMLLRAQEGKGEEYYISNFIYMLFIIYVYIFLLWNCLQILVCSKTNGLNAQHRNYFYLVKQWPYYDVELTHPVGFTSILQVWHCKSPTVSYTAWEAREGPFESLSLPILQLRAKPFLFWLFPKEAFLHPDSPRSISHTITPDTVHHYFFSHKISHEAQWLDSQDMTKYQQTNITT